MTRWLNMVRAQAVLMFVVALATGAGGTIVLLEQHSDASRQAESRIGTVRFTLLDLENAPFTVAPRVRGSAARALARILSDQTSIRRNLGDLIARGGAPAPLSRVQRAVDAAGPEIKQIFESGSSPGGYTGPNGGAVNGDNFALQARVASTLGVLTDVARIYSRRAATAKNQAMIGSLATISLLLLAFALFYRAPQAWLPRMRGCSWPAWTRRSPIRSPAWATAERSSATWKKCSPALTSGTT